MPFIVEGGSVHHRGRVLFFKGGWEPFVDKGGRMPFYKKTPLEGAVCRGSEPFIEGGTHSSMRDPFINEGPVHQQGSRLLREGAVCRGGDICREREPFVDRERTPFAEGGRTRFIEGGTPFVNEGGRMLQVDKGGRMPFIKEGGCRSSTREDAVCRKQVG